MTKQTKALRMAIEAFDMYGNKMNSAFTDKAYQACEEALAQPTAEQSSLVQEPFGIWHVGDTEEESDFFLYKDSGDVSCEHCIKLYTSPPSREWVGLSGDEFVAIAKSIWGDNLGMGDGYGYTVAWASSYATIEPSSKMLLLYHAIERALREKNNA